jgi:hypothetical protein
MFGIPETTENANGEKQVGWTDRQKHLLGSVPNMLVNARDAAMSTYGPLLEIIKSQLKSKYRKEMKQYEALMHGQGVRGKKPHIKTEISCVKG